MKALSLREPRHEKTGMMFFRTGTSPTQLLHNLKIQEDITL